MLTVNIYCDPQLSPVYGLLWMMALICFVLCWSQYVRVLSWCKKERGALKSIGPLALEVPWSRLRSQMLWGKGSLGTVLSVWVERMVIAEGIQFRWVYLLWTIFLSCSHLPFRMEFHLEFRTIMQAQFSISWKHCAILENRVDLRFILK